MFDHPAHSITTVDGETGTDFVAVSAGLTAALTVHYGTVVRRRLGPVVGYARFGSDESEAIYADGTGLHRASTVKPTRYETDMDGRPAVVSILPITS